MSGATRRHTGGGRNPRWAVSLSVSSAERLFGFEDERGARHCVPGAAFGGDRFHRNTHFTLSATWAGGREQGDTSHLTVTLIHESLR